MAGTTHRTYVSYIDRTREHYAALGYTNPYAYAHHIEVPFSRPSRPLSQSRVALLTTASPWQDDPSKQHKRFARREVWSAPSATPPDRLFTENLAWDKESTHTRDVESFLPLRRLSEAAAAGRIGSVGPRYYGIPTEYSQSRTMDHDAPAVLALCREDQVDVALIAAL
ncbi:MAG TPA: hypothetical protein PK359_04630 [Burkholderiaceae bacterium]|jgi:hypothetical protein|nr:hypothetical protein [Burkholderiaceae bacterium]